MDNSTIAAISTAYGEAGIGIVRMTGPDSLSILKKVFKNKDCMDISFNPRHMYYGFVVNPIDNTVIDESLAVYMKAPYTYTGEDVCEIQCHGGNISVKNILALLLNNGAVLADKGEFTKRAFLNGKIDLSQAEAVIDLIKAKTDRAFDVAVVQLEGSLSKKVKEIRQELLDLLVNLTVNMDYPDEDIEVLTYDKFKTDIQNIYDQLITLNSSSNEGRILREGLKVAIVGKPNVGKSSLMNYFLREDRSIVTNIPGTTRDTIEETASVKGIPIVFIDTAGIHDSDDVVESIGIERSKTAFNNADLILLVLDASSPLTEEDKELITLSKDRPCITILNKTDIGCVLDLEGIKVSIKNNINTSQIDDAIEKYIDSGSVRRQNDVIITNIRHSNLISKSITELSEALNMIEAMEAMDFIEVNIKAVFDYLGEIIGETASDEVIDEVFSRFCLGK